MAPALRTQPWACAPCRSKGEKRSPRLRRTAGLEGVVLDRASRLSARKDTPFVEQVSLWGLATHLESLSMPFDTRHRRGLMERTVRTGQSPGFLSHLKPKHLVRLHTSHSLPSDLQSRVAGQKSLCMSPTPTRRRPVSGALSSRPLSCDL